MLTSSVIVPQPFLYPSTWDIHIMLLHDDEPVHSDHAMYFTLFKVLSLIHILVLPLLENRNWIAFCTNLVSDTGVSFQGSQFPLFRVIEALENVFRRRRKSSSLLIFDSQNAK